MSRSESRRAKLRALIDDQFGGKAADFARRVGIDPTYVTRMLYPPGKAGRKGIGEDSVSKIEEALSIRGYFDGPSSQPMRLDPVILAESIAALRQVAKRRGWSYDPEIHAESTCYAYELWQELPSKPSTADVIDLGERIAERLRTEMGGNDGGNQSGTGAGAGADDREQPGQRGDRKARASGGSR